MPSPWIVHVNPDPGGAGDSLTFSLSFRLAQTEKEVTAIEPCPSLDRFKERVRELGISLNAAAGDAEKKLAELASNGGGGKPPEELWAEMAGKASEDEMANYFNALGEQQRCDVADYVFGHVGMFSGKGPVFAQRYNSDSHFME